MSRSPIIRPCASARNARVAKTSAAANKNLFHLPSFLNVFLAFNGSISGDGSGPPFGMKYNSLLGAPCSPKANVQVYADQAVSIIRKKRVVLCPFAIHIYWLAVLCRTGMQQASLATSAQFCHYLTNFEALTLSDGQCFRLIANITRCFFWLGSVGYSALYGVELTLTII